MECGKGRGGGCSGSPGAQEPRNGRRRRRLRKRSVRRHCYPPASRRLGWRGPVPRRRASSATAGERQADRQDLGNAAGCRVLDDLAVWLGSPSCATGKRARVAGVCRRVRATAWVRRRRPTSGSAARRSTRPPLACSAMPAPRAIARQVRSDRGLQVGTGSGQAGDWAISRSSTKSPAHMTAITSGRPPASWPCFALAEQRAREELVIAERSRPVELDRLLSHEAVRVSADALVSPRRSRPRSASSGARAELRSR